MAIDVGKTGFSNTDAFYFTFHKMIYALSKKQNSTSVENTSEWIKS